MRDVDPVTILVVAEGVVILLLGLLVAGLLRSHADILRQLHDLGVGDHSHDGPGFRIHPAMPAPGSPTAGDEGSPVFDVTGTDPRGGAVGIRVTGATQPTLLAFLSAGCTTCGEFWQALSDPASSRGLARLVIVTKGPENESPASIAGLAPRDVPVVMSDRAWGDYGVPGSPYFVLATADRVVGEGTATTWEQLRGLVEQAAADMVHPAAGAQPVNPSRSHADRADRVDAELRAAGIEPGHPSLYEHPEEAQPGEQR